MVRTHFGQHGDDCFGCRLQTINLGFGGRREQFHGDTIRERQRDIIDRAKANGYSPEPVGSRWV